MSVRRRSRLKVVVESLVAFAISFALVALVIVFFRGDDQNTQADVAPNAVGVDEVVNLESGGSEVAVTGFAFVGVERSILCSARTTDEPPFCDGTTIELVNLDTSRLDLVVPDDGPAYSRDEITLIGTYDLATLTVADILQG